MGLQKGGLRPIAKDKMDLHKEYELRKKEDDSIQECWAHERVVGTQHKGLKEFMDCHHVNGREGGRNILDYVYVCKNCHRFIHANPNKARELKLLNF